MNEQSLVTLGDKSLSVDELIHSVEYIRDAMKKVMVRDTHFGKIPGCGDKDALLQPGAHKLGLLFNLAEEYNVEKRFIENDHLEVFVTTRLTRRDDGLFIGEGVGMASTMESRYRFRWDNTGIPVPEEYWTTRDKDILGGSSFTPRKVWVQDEDDNTSRQRWMIFQQVYHENPADYYNTVIKIAKKRSYNDAILTNTAASDIFIPDDDLPESFIQPDSEEPKPKADKKDVIPFGKNKGKLWSEAPTSWLKWCASNAKADNIKARAQKELDVREKNMSDSNEETIMAGEDQIRAIRKKCEEQNISIPEMLEVLNIESTDKIREMDVEPILLWLGNPSERPKLNPF